MPTHSGRVRACAAFRVGVMAATFYTSPDAAMGRTKRLTPFSRLVEAA
jgi:hypothetical protein